VGWITGIGQEGRLVTADVEWTPRGAKAIRNEDYRHISPTFVADYRDEHGDKHGKALIGAALTNRPVLRKGMPCLSLSRDRFDDVATPPKRKKKTMTKLSKPELVTLSRSTDEKEIKRLYARATPKQLRKAVGMCLARGDTARARAGLAPASTGSALSPDAVITLAQYAPAGAAYAGTTDWGAPADGVRRQPPGLDDGQHRPALLRRDGGRHRPAKLSRHSDLPSTPVRQDGQIPEREDQDANARALAVSAGISWTDALAILEQLGELSALKADTGAADVPWLDTRVLATPPRPWSQEDWNRDQRRATAAGVVVGSIGPDGQDTQLKSLWQSGAEQGRDVVGEMAAELRQKAIDDHQAFHAGDLDQARAREDGRRSSAINSELIRRARQRVAAPGQANGRAAW
jgi:hypothetical protein